MRQRLIPGLVVAAVLGATAVSTAGAQLVEARAPRGLLGINAQLARPVGEFQRYVDWGGGLQLYGVLHLDPNRMFGIRVDGAFLIYGHESYQTPLGPRIARILVDVDTDNYIFSLGVGPQITIGRGALRPYAFGTAGFSYFATISSVGGSADVGDFASTTNFDDLTFALAAGGGILLRVSRGKHPVALDLSVQSTRNGQAEYLRRGGIVEEPDGTLVLFPIRSETNLVTFRAGVAVGI